MTTPLRPRSLQSLSDQQRFAQTGGRWSPPPLSSLDDTGLTKLNVADHVLKILYFGGDLTGSEVADRIRLPFSGVLDSVFGFLPGESSSKFTARYAQGYSEATYRCLISMKGHRKGASPAAVARAGPAPVPLDQYITSVNEQNRERKLVTQEVLRGAMDQLVISDEMLNRVGPAVNGGRSVSPCTARPAAARRQSPDVSAVWCSAGLDIRIPVFNRRRQPDHPDHTIRSTMAVRRAGTRSLHDRLGCGSTLGMYQTPDDHGRR
ncbi:MAG: hypothetical protein HND48_11305 [Chloroflexi bacterium]|nr:hypothetical protein [Chloroflexota bacterium]